MQSLPDGPLHRMHQRRLSPEHPGFEEFLVANSRREPRSRRKYSLHHGETEHLEVVDHSPGFVKAVFFFEIGGRYPPFRRPGLVRLCKRSSVTS